MRCDVRVESNEAFIDFKVSAEHNSRFFHVDCTQYSGENGNRELGAVKTVILMNEEPRRGKSLPVRYQYLWPVTNNCRPFSQYAVV